PPPAPPATDPSSGHHGPPERLPRHSGSPTCYVAAPVDSPKREPTVEERRPTTDNRSPWSPVVGRRSSNRALSARPTIARRQELLDQFAMRLRIQATTDDPA